MKPLKDVIKTEQEEYDRCVAGESSTRNYYDSALTHKYYIELFKELQAYREKFGTKFANKVDELEEDECMCIYCNRVFKNEEKRMFIKKDNPKLCICFDCY